MASLILITRAAYLVRRVSGERFMETSPRVDIGGFAHGTSGRIAGNASGLKKQPLLSPLTGTPCLFYEVNVYEDTGLLWHQTLRETQRCDFSVEDSTGTALVRAGSADFNFHDHGYLEAADGFEVSVSPDIRSNLLSLYRDHGKPPPSARWRARERVIAEGPVTVLGRSERVEGAELGAQAPYRAGGPTVEIVARIVSTIR